MDWVLKKNIPGQIGYGLGTGIGIKYWVNRVLSGIENLDRVFLGFLPYFSLEYKNVVNKTCLWWTDLDLHAFGSSRSSLITPWSTTGPVRHFLKFRLGLVPVCIHPTSGHPGRPDVNSFSAKRWAENATNIKVVLFSELIMPFIHNYVQIL